MKMIKSTGFTIKNTRNYDKPNEDYYICDDKLKFYVIADGVSRDKIGGKYPNPSPAYEVSKIFCDNLYKLIDNIQFTNENCSFENELFEAIKLSNDCIYKSNKHYIYDYFLPGTVAVIVLIIKNELYYAYIGDCEGCLLQNNEINKFTVCQTESISRNVKNYSAKTVRTKICNNINHIDGYGVLNGEEEALDFVRLGKIKLDSKFRILLYSDGFSEIINQLSYGKLKSLNIKHLIDDKNIEGQDDRTIIIIDKIEE